MKRSKFDIETIDVEITHFVQATKGSAECGEYLLTQLAVIVAELPKRKQIEFLNGLINAKQEMA